MKRGTGKKAGGVVSAVSHIKEVLAACGISVEDYDDLIQALFLAAPKDPKAHTMVKKDIRGYPMAQTSVSKFFGDVIVNADDRGPVYAVWVRKFDENRVTAEVIGFTEIQWGQK
jgi:hypothetical protein